MTHRPELSDLVAIPGGAPPAPASDVEGRDLTGRRRTLGLTTPGRWTLLLFLGSHCDGCLPFWSVPRAPLSCGLEPQDRVVLVTRGPGEEDPGQLAALTGAQAAGDRADAAGDRADATGDRADAAGDRADAADAAGALVMSGSAWRAYRVLGPPFFVLLDGVAVVIEGVAWSLEQVAADVARARRRTAGQRTTQSACRPPVRR